MYNAQMYPGLPNYPRALPVAVRATNVIVGPLYVPEDHVELESLRVQVAQKDARIADLERRLRALEPGEGKEWGDWYDPELYTFSEN